MHHVIEATNYRAFTENYLGEEQWKGNLLLHLFFANTSEVVLINGD